MDITMTATVPASLDGITVQLFKAGASYDVPDALGGKMIKQKWAKPTPKPGPGPDEDKRGKGPEENK